MILIEKVEISKNPVKVNETFVIQISAKEVHDYPLFMFPFSNESLSEKLLEISAV